MRDPGIRAFDPRRVLFGNGLVTFLWVLALTAIARGAAYLPAYSVDEYNLLLLEQPEFALSMSQGRFGQALLLWGLRGLGAEARFSTVLFVTVALLTSAAFAVVLLRHWRLPARGWLAVIAGSLAVLHPYSAEQFTFRTALGINTIGLALFVPLLVPRRWTPRLLIAGAVLAAVALSVYQIVLHYVVAIALLGLAIDLTRANRASLARPDWTRRTRRTAVSLSAWLSHRRVGLLAATFLGSVLYFGLAQVTTRLSGVPMTQRAAFIAPAAFGGRLTDVWAVLRERFWTVDPLTPEWVRVLQVVLLAGALLTAIAGTRAWRDPRRAARIAATVLIVAVSIVWSVGLLFVTAEFWPAPRVMAHVGVLWAGVVAIWFVASAGWPRRMLAMLAGTMLLSYIGVSNHILQDQLRLNARDAMKANRIVARLEALPEFQKITAVIILGASWRYGYMYETTDHDMHTSALAPPWARVNLLREISGYRFPDQADAGESAAAIAYCASTEPWPAPAAVMQRGRLAVVCLGRGQ